LSLAGDRQHYDPGKIAVQLFVLPRGIVLQNQRNFDPSRSSAEA
jgi:hypothetical protein